MADYPFTHGKYEGTMASVVYNNKSYVKWVMEKQDATGPVLKFH